MSDFQIDQIGPFLDMPLVDKEGKVTAEWRPFLENVWDVLMNVISPEGIAIPPQSAANIAILNTSQSIGKVLYNTDTQAVMLNNTGTFETITVS